MFADISGFTAMSERLDPEEVTGVMNAFFKVLVDPIYRYGGVVDKYIGDAIMAVFGAPIAHEDDATRALLAAWEMREQARKAAADLKGRSGVELRIRIGLNTGLAVYDAVGGTPKRDFTVMGDTVNLAQRMEASAEPGQVLVSAQTHDAAARMFTFKALPQVRVKGKAETIAVFQLQGRRASTVLLGGRVLAETFVGREAELGRLEAAWQAAQDGSPRYLAITGEAGVGKSALVRRFLDLAQARGARVLRASARSYFSHDGSTLLEGLVRHLLGLGADAPAAAARPEIERFLAEHGLADPRREALLGHLLGNPAATEPGAVEAHHRSALLAFSEILRSLAQHDGLILSLADLQWADAVSLEWLDSFLASLGAEVPSARLLILCQARPGASFRPATFDGAGEIAIQSFDRENAFEMAFAMLGGGDLPPGAIKFLRLVAGRSDGNPFFLAEMLRAAVESGALRPSGASWEVAPDAAPSLPASVHAAVAARLDHLPADLRETLALAAILGRRFDPAILAAVSGAAIDRQLGELLRLKFLRPVSEREVGFVQAMVHEAALEGMLQVARRDLHLRVVQALEARGDAAAAVLAHHLAAAGMPGKAAGYALEAGRAAVSRYELADGRERYLAALAHGEAAPDEASPDRAAILLELAGVERILGHFDAALSRLDARRLLAEDTARSLRTRGDILMRKGDLRAALDAYEAAARRDQEPLEAALALAGVGDVQRRLGAYEEAIATSRQALGAMEETGQPAEAATAHGVIGICFHRLGRHEAALREHEVALELREIAGDQEGVARSASNLGAIEATLERWQPAQAHLTRALNLFRRIGDRRSVANTLNNLGDALLRMGNLEAAERHFREALKVSRQLGDVGAMLAELGNLAEIALRRQAGAEALGLLDVCAELMASSGHHEYAADITAARRRAVEIMSPQAGP